MLITVIVLIIMDHNIITYSMFRAEICHGNLTYIRVSADSADERMSRSSIVTVKWLMPCPACQIHDASEWEFGWSSLSLSPYVWFGHWPGQMDMHPSLLETTITVAHRADSVSWSSAVSSHHEHCPRSSSKHQSYGFSSLFVRTESR